MDHRDYYGPDFRGASTTVEGLKNKLDPKLKWKQWEPRFGIGWESEHGDYTIEELEIE